MVKRYRAPKVLDGQIKLQRGSVDGASDICLFYGGSVPRCDRALVMNALCMDSLSWDSEVRPSLTSELEKRGYDMDTLKFSIERLPE